MNENHLDNVVPLARHTSPGVPTSADVVIVGGGIMGTSIAYHLAAAGVRNIVLVERNLLGSGSSAKPLGGVRATFSDPGNIQLGQRSLEAYESFSDKFGVDIGLRQVGYLFLCRTEAELAEVEASTHVQNLLGGSSQMLSPEQACALNPFLDPSVLLGASYSPRDGFAQPSKVVKAFADGARELGVSIYENVEVMAIDSSGGEVRAVHTNAGSITTDTVICAAGAWSSRLGNMVGVHLPIKAVRRQIGMTPQQPVPFPTVPFTLDLSTTLYFHNYLNGMLLGISNSDQEPGFGREFDYQWVPAFNQAAEIVAPSLANLELEAGWAGLYENTPDHNAMIGSSDTVSGFMYATGFSGHGFLQGPAVGELVRDMYLGKESFMDVKPFSAARFTNELARVREVHII